MANAVDLHRQFDSSVGRKFSLPIGCPYMAVAASITTTLACTHRLSIEISAGTGR